MSFYEGRRYSRAEISDVIGGKVQDFLSCKDKVIVAGCIIPEMNPHAHHQIYVGDGRDIVQHAEWAAEQKEPIPCFLKRGSKEFEYLGLYRPTNIDRDPDRIRRAEAETR